MKHHFVLELSSQEEEYLFDLLRRSIEYTLARQKEIPASLVPPPPAGLLLQPLGAFVTLHLQGKLRGCIGLLQSKQPLYLNVASMAHAAAFRDGRFRPLSLAEWPQVDFDISILGPSELCPDLQLIELGRHGLILEAFGRRAVFLPQVPVEQGWDLPTTLKHLSLKAALPAKAWQEPGAKIFYYQSLLIKP